MRRTESRNDSTCRMISSAVLLVAVLAATGARGQLVVTELMYDPLDSGDTAWEWIEVYNTGAAIDLDGYYAGRIGDLPPFNPAVNGTLATNTVIPGGSTAVLYRGNLGGPGNYDDQAFRDAWGLSASVPLVAVENWPALTNTGGTAVGFWPTSGVPAAATADDGMGVFKIDNFTDAAFSIDYRTENNFPVSGNGNSIAWSGNGSNQDGMQWSVSTTAGGATTSSTVIQAGEQINATSDAGSPGVVPAGPAASGLLISEIMYNPRSADASWEWVEIYNNTGATIDFNNNYVFHDTTTTADLTAPNIGPGTVANGQAAVLYNADALTMQNMIDAWDPGGALGVNFIGVTSFPALGNGGDTVAIWPSLAAYESDSTVSPRTTTATTASQTYDDDGVVWPQDNGDSSVFLLDLSADATDGFNWLLHTAGDFAGGRNAAAAFGSVEIHPGGDVGTPGSFTAGGNDADFNDDGDVDATDLATWEAAFGGAATAATGDADGNGVADGADFLLWQRQYTGSVSAVGAVPEPTAVALLLAGLGAVATGLASRRN